MAAFDRFATDYATLGSRALQLRNLLPLLDKGDGQKKLMAGPIPRPSLRRLRYYYPPIIFCHYHFNRGNRKHGDKCPYRNSQKHYDKKKSIGIGKATRPRVGNKNEQLGSAAKHKRQPFAQLAAQRCTCVWCMLIHAMLHVPAE